MMRDASSILLWWELESRREFDGRFAQAAVLSQRVHQRQVRFQAGRVSEVQCSSDSKTMLILQWLLTRNVTIRCV